MPFNADGILINTLYLLKKNIARKLLKEL